MKKMFLAIVMLVGMTTWAQEKEGRSPEREKLSPEQRVDLQVKRMTKDLNLNEKQISDVRALITKESEKREAKKAEMKEKREMKVKGRKEAKAYIEKERAAADAEMKKILTPEQYAKWDKIREERKANMKEKMMERREENGMERDLEPIKK
jgi:Spy/CpxP family protein refolding chaperone